MGRKRALLVGINYPGTKAELKGCHNDVARMRRSLVDLFGFDEADIRVLSDADRSAPQPTGANIRRELARLVGDARPGDFLFFHYSGHGTRLPAETGQDDDTGYDECIVPSDMNLITDQDFTELVQKVPDDCLFTIVSDSCHSGGLLDKTKEQIGHSTKQNQTQQSKREERSDSGSGSGFGFRSFLKETLKETVRDTLESRGVHIPHRQSSRGNDDGDNPSMEYSSSHGGDRIKNRSLPLSTLIEMLKEKTGKDDIDVGSIRMTLFTLFGDDASPKIKKFMKVMLTKLQEGQHGGVMGLVGALAQEFMKAKLEGKPEGDALEPAMKQEVHSVQEVYAGTTARVSNGVLISGCQTDQTSADATTPKGVSFGALSNAIQTILSEKNGKVTNKDLVLRARELLSKQGYTQQPGLYCSDKHTSVAFIC
uniref:Peptidase C14 caspase domain-containing protein n=1 Tax=Leersia perrieri TaxID=77586 RepID=A0A0D9WI67_9ORYZ